MGEIGELEDPSQDQPPAGRDDFSRMPSSGRPRRDIEWIFLGPRGLRAGWAVLIFVSIFVALTVVTGIFFAHFVQMNVNASLPVGTALALEIWQLALVVIATWLMSVFERKPMLSYGYQGRARAVRCVSGMAWGFVAISTLVFGLAKMGYLSLQGRVLDGEAAVRYALLWGVVFLLTGFFEESLFRGYVQFTLTRGIGFWWGALLFTPLFGLIHRTNPGESPVGLVAAAGVGLVFCLSLWYTGSLWWAVGFHAAWDWGQSYFYGTADSGMMAQGHLLQEHPVGAILWSGGTTGPEGSILVLPLLAVIAVLMVLWWGRRVRSPFAGAGWRPLRIQQRDTPAAPYLRSDS